MTGQYRHMDKISMFKIPSNTIRKNNLSVIILILILLFGFSLTSWRLIEYRGRLINVINNKKWEATLRNEGLLDDNVIVFFGDSEIALWVMSTSFGVLPIINKGISGDWAATAVSRFNKDVISLSPRLVVILIGTNDLEKNQPIASITKNIEFMVEKAKDHKIRVVLCSLLPTRGKHTKNRPADQLHDINNQLIKISDKHRADYVDFYSLLSDQYGYFDKKYTSDGLHPNQEGYLQMAAALYPVLIKNILSTGDL